MAIKSEVRRNAGHPWDGRHGFDVLLLNADNQAEMDDAVRAAEAKFWQPWLIGTNASTGRPGGGMYKPCGAQAPWHDPPDRPHPGCTDFAEREG